MAVSIDSLTVGEVRQVWALLGGERSAVNLYSRYVGKYVIVRSRNDGVNSGTVVAIDETGVILADARRLWYHKPANKSESWFEGVANHGLSNDSKISAPVAEKAIVESYSITLCSEDAETSLKGFVSHGQS